MAAELRSIPTVADGSIKADASDLGMLRFP